MRRQITLAEILKTFGESLKATMYHAMPGVVVAYYPGSPATVDVQPAINDVRFDPDTNERSSEAWPVIPHVPVCYPAGSGFSVTFPLAVGDPVELLADDLDPTIFLQTGAQADPSDVRRHGGTYWKCYPCNRTDKNAPTAGTTMKIGKGSTVIEFDGTNISLGGVAVTDHVALASVVDLFIKTVLGWAPVTGDGGAALKSALTGAGFSTSSTSKSTLVKTG